MANTINGFAIRTLSVVHFVGVNAMYGLVVRNGYVQALLRLRDYGPHLLPGSDHPILMRFTGLWPLDRLLTLAGVMFANVTDGSAPQLSLYGFYFGGQLVPIFTTMVIESLREGNRGTAMTLSVLWGYAMQATGYGFTMPIYAITHLLTSRTAAGDPASLRPAVHVSDVVVLESLLTALALGYVAPTILMALPLPWNQLHQWLGGFWQGFPLWVVMAQRLLAWRRSRGKTQGTILYTVAATPVSKPAARNDSPPPAVAASSPPSHTNIHTMRVLHSVCQFTFIFATICQWTTFGVIGARWLFPFLFSSRLRQAFTIKEVFLPPPFWNPGKMDSMASGILNFFQYDLYVGSVAAFIWATALNINAIERRHDARLLIRCFWDIVALSVVAGPGGALISLIWSRDERVLLGNE